MSFAGYFVKSTVFQLTLVVSYSANTLLVLKQSLKKIEFELYNTREGKPGQTN